jgi:hypothetical protein
MKDHDEIVQAALDYVEGWYASDGERMGKALHPSLAKRRVTPEGEVWDVTRDWMIEATENGQGKIENPEDGMKNIRVLDQTPTMASVKVVSAEFDDYLHLAKTQGEWKIVNALWDYKQG